MIAGSDARVSIASHWRQREPVTSSRGSERLTGMEKAVLETRWIILGTDGRHVTLGRHSDPTPEELQQAETQLAERGLAGWLAVMKGGYWKSRPKPSLMMVRPLRDPQRPFAEAAEAFEAARKAMLATPP